jgi:hypothetical protein
MTDGVDTIGRNFGFNVYTIQITSPMQLPNATQKSPYNYTLTVSGGTPPYTFTQSCCIPSGLSFNSTTGQISGTPTSAGQSTFQVTVTDANSVSYYEDFGIDTIGVPPALPNLSGGAWNDCTIGMYCSFQTRAYNGGTAPFTWNVTGLPPGMSFRSDRWNTYPGNVEYWGVPTSAGSYNVQVSMTDASGVVVSQTFPLNVSLLTYDCCFNSGTVGVLYPPSTMVVLGGTGPYTQQRAGGVWPDGLSLSGSTLSGTPLESGSFSESVVFTDSAAHTLQASPNVYINPAGTIHTINVGSYDLGSTLVNVSYSRSLSACCVPSYAWTLVGGTLPPGLAFSTSGQLSGTPTTVGSYAFLVQVADAQNSANYATRQFILNVTTLSVTTGYTLPWGNVGTAYSQALAATGGSGTLTWTLAINNYLPPGLTLSSAGVLSGTPTAAGQFYFTVNVSDASGHTNTASFGVAIYAAGATPPLYLSVGTNLGPYRIGPVLQYQLNPSGGKPPYAFAMSPGASAIPGMRIQVGPPLPTSFSSTTPAGYVGLIATPGVYNSSIRVSDSVGATFDSPFTITVSPLNILTSYSMPQAALSTPYSFLFTGYGGSGTYSWSATNLPPGLTLSTSGQLSGTPTSTGGYSPSVTITDTSNSASISVGFYLLVNPFAITTSGALPVGTVGTAYSQTLSAPGCGSGCTWSFYSGYSLPSGLTLSSTGVISGTPTTTFNNYTTLQASGSNGTVRQTFALQVLANSPQPLGIVSATAYTTQIGSSVGNTLSATGGSPPYIWSLVSGSLPPGVSLQSPGESLSSGFTPGYTYLWGYAMQGGSYSFTLRVTDNAGATATQTITWYVPITTLSFTSLPTPTTPLTYNTAYTQGLLALGGTGNYTTWLATTAMPTGLSLNSTTGVVTGVPTSTGRINTSIQVTDDAGNTVTQTVSFTVSSPTGSTLTIGIGPDLGTIALGSTISYTLTNYTSGGTAPYTFTALSALPPGCILQNGLLYCAPTTPGNFTFAVQALDSLGNTGERTLTLHVAPFARFTTGTLANGTVGTPYSQKIVSWDNTGTVTWSLAAGYTMPPGLSVSGDTISGTPTAAGSYSFTLAATDASEMVVNYSFSLVISPIGITDALALPQATAGAPYTYTFAATGGGSTKTWSATGLPSGLTMSASGTISGTTTSTGMYSVNVTVTDGSAPITRLFTLFSHYSSPSLLSIPQSYAVPVVVSLGSSYTTTLTPSGGAPPYTWSVAPGSALPPGMFLVSGASLPPNYAPGSTILTGVPTAAGDYSFDLIATDSRGAQARRTSVFHITPIRIVSSPANPTVGSAYSGQFVVEGGTPPYTFTYAPRWGYTEMFPPGITASASGVFSGTPTGAGYYYFVPAIRDNAGNTWTTTGAYGITVVEASGMAITASQSQPTLSAGKYGYYVYLSATGGTSPYTWSVTPGSALPPGFSLATNVLTEKPAIAGNFTFSLRATDSAATPHFTDRAFSCTVAPFQIPILGSYLPMATQGSAYSYEFPVAGGAAPYTFVENPTYPLPPGLTLSQDGQLSGTPTQASGSSNINFTGLCVERPSDGRHQPNGRQ